MSETPGPKKPFIERAVDRVLVHWQSSLFGLSYVAIFVFLARKDVTVGEAIMLLTAILGFKSIFYNKDADKVANKDKANDPPEIR